MSSFSARELMATQPGLTLAEANAAAWQTGRTLLERAIQERLDFAFETTLGGNTIPRLLGEAARRGIEIFVWYVGLESLQLHVERVAAGEGVTRFWAPLNPSSDLGGRGDVFKRGRK